MITESWTNPDIPCSAIAVPNFSIFRYDRNGKLGGVCIIYIHINICATQIMSPISLPNSEQVNVAANINDANIHLSCIHISPKYSQHILGPLCYVFTLLSNGTYTNSIIGVILTYLTIVNHTHPIIVTNLRHFQLTFNTLGWTQQIKFSTRSPNTLDILFYSK